MTLGERWSRFWFDPAPPIDLGVCRLLFYGLLAAGFVPRSPLVGFTDVTSDFWLPISYFDALDLPLFSAGILSFIERAWWVSLALAAVGLATRPATFVAFVLGLYALGLPGQFGRASHGNALLLVALGILAFSRSGDAVSLDAVVRRLRSRSTGAAAHATAPPPSGEYRWPIRAVWVGLSLVFCAAGIAKLRHTGLDWAWSIALEQFIPRGHYIEPAFMQDTYGLALLRHPGLLRGLQIFTLVIELGYPLALFVPRTRVFIVLGGLALLVGIEKTMGLPFRGLMMCSLFWVPWSRLGSAFRARMRPRSALAG